MSQTRRETSFLTLSSPAASCKEIKPFFTHSISPAPLIVLNHTHGKQNIYHNINEWAKMQGSEAGRGQNFRKWISCFSSNRKLPLAKKPLIIMSSSLTYLLTSYLQFNGFFLSVSYNFWNLQTFSLKQSFQKTFFTLKFANFLTW